MKKEKVLILGIYQGSTNRIEFEAMAQLLRLNGFVASIPQDLFEHVDEPISLRYEAQRILTIELLNCDRVVTLKDWELEKINLKLIGFAHEFNITVDHFTKYLPKTTASL